MLSTICIEPSGVPIYLQIKDQLLRAIGAGVLQPGEKMPTMRQVAVALRIDLNTVRHAYEALARTGAIVIQPARGTFVALQPPEVDQASVTDRITGLAHRTIASAKANGLDPVEVARHIILITNGRDVVR